MGTAFCSKGKLFLILILVLLLIPAVNMPVPRCLGQEVSNDEDSIPEDPLRTEVMAQLEQALAYRQNAQYAPAEQTYLIIILQYPDTQYALQAQWQMVLLYLEQGKEAEAQTAYDNLLFNFSDDPQLAGAICDIALYYRRTQKFETANQMYQYVRNRWPHGDHEAWLQAGLAVTNIMLGNENAAPAAIDTLVTEFSDHPYIANMIQDIAFHYHQARNFNKAIQYNQYVVEHWPDAEYALWCQVGVVNSNLDLENEYAADAALDKLFTDYNEQDNIGNALYEIAKHYFDLRKYQRAAQIYQQLADQWPESTYVLDWQKGAVMCYFYLENDTAAQTALDKLKANFSENPQLAAVLCDIALNYRRAKKFPIADQLYQYVLENQPEGEHEVWLQQGLAITNIMLGREEAAQTAIDILLQDFSDYQYIPNIIQDIAYHYYQAEKYDRAVQYNQHVVEHWPESDYALWCQVGLVNSQVKLGKNSEAQEALNKLLTDYAERADIAQAVQEVTKHYHVEGNKDKAQELSQYIVDHWPESDPAAEYRSQMESTIVSNINLGNDEEVQAAIDELIAASGNPLPLSDTMIRLGEAYYTNGRLAQSKHQEEEAKENFIKAIGVWERIINELPAAAAYTPRMYFMCAVVYAQELQQYAKGIDYFREVTVDWPEFEAACDCYYQMGRYYYPWRDEGGISPEEAEQLTEAAYGQVVAKYPACWLSGSAAIYLGHKFFHQGQWEKAAEYLEFYLGTDGPERQAATAMLGEAFQKLDMPGLTEELYRDYLQAADPNDAWAEEFQKRLQDLGVKP